MAKQAAERIEFRSRAPLWRWLRPGWPVSPIGRNYGAAKRCSKMLEYETTVPRRIKRASGFFRTPGRPGSPPPELLKRKIRLRGKSENGTRVPILRHQSATL